jgi:succinate dehydrogenase/fumarate reductase flavoprotein subunit
VAVLDRDELDVDVAVLGSGACGLVAAVAAADSGARVALLERSEKIGGTSAISGGIAWVPNNHLQARLGIADSREQALAYLESLSLGVMDMELATTFVERGPEMIRSLEERTPLRFHVAERYPDYHPERPGGLAGGGRSLDPDLFSFAQLGAWAERVLRPGSDLHPQELIVPITLYEGLEQLVPGPDVLAERAKRDERGLGQALVGALLKGCLDRAVEIRTATRARELLREGRAVTGVRAESGGRDVLVRARRGVILATGGFEWNADLVRAFLRGPLLGPASPPENEGDALVMAMEAGAQLANMSEAWWMPTIPIPGETIGGKPLFRICLAERTLPGSLIVNHRARRFVNEAANYNDIGRAFHTFDPTHFSFLNAEAWLVFDDAYARKYPVAGFRPGAPRPKGLVHSGATLGELARSLGLDPDALAATVARFNELVEKGEDSDFQRGRSAYDSYNGDRTKRAPFTTLGALTEPPFHAIRLVAGALGTKGGPKTNASAQVLDPRGRVIPGLYAAGNAMAGATGLVYGGAGGTLGPGMTFGYIAGRVAAGRD